MNQHYKADNMINKEIIPKEILPYLIEIANRLWSGHAAIMIGAGFSKNAKKNSTTKKKISGLE
jgi:hypothetical protein